MSRLISFIMLLIFLVTLSGLGVTASAMIRASAVDVCCTGGDEMHDGIDDSQNNELKIKQEWGASCYGAGCLCVFCLPDDLNAGFSPGLPSTLFRTAFGSSSSIDLTGFILSIEYPPETA